MRGWHLIPIALVALAVVALPVVALTDTGVERKVRDGLGLPAVECEPMTNPDSPWAEGPALPYDLDEPRAVALGGSIYLLGGVTDVEQLADGRLLLQSSDALLRFDPRKGTYAELTPLPEPLNHIAAVAHRGDIYVAGGYGSAVDANTSDRFYRYDVSNDSWARLPDLPAPRAAMAAGVLGEVLVLAGGARDNVPRRETFAYDFAAERWTVLESRLPQRREHVGGAVAGGSLYVLGGRTREATAARATAAYGGGREGWSRLKPMPVPSGGLAAVAEGGKIFAVGGGDDIGGTVTGAVQRLDPRTGRWELLPSLRTARHGHGAAVADGKIWVFGGSPCAYFNATDDVEWLSTSRL